MLGLRTTLGLLFTTALPLLVRAQPVGDEFQINTYTTGNQTTAFGRPLVASDPSGNLVFVWTSRFGQDGSSAGIFGQRYDSAGETLGTEFRVNSYTTNSQLGPCIGKIQWTHDLGHRATFRIELDRGDDGTFEELITAAAPSDSTRGSLAWTVTGPPSGTARVRVSWSDDPAVFDASDVTFQIRPVGGS